MKDQSSSLDVDKAQKTAGSAPCSISSAGFASSMAAALIGWLILSCGFLGLKMLMRERPQFTGADLSVSDNQVLQVSPRVFARKSGDDVSSVFSIQPDSTSVHFTMLGRRDYRGLKTILDMAGVFEGLYTISNPFSEPLHVLFKCSHPKNGAGIGRELNASNLKLESSVEGVQAHTDQSWVWSGTLPPRSETKIRITYETSNLNSLRYEVSPKTAGFVNAHQVVFDFDGIESVHCVSGEGRKELAGDQVRWNKDHFLAPDFFEAKIVETRNLYTGLMHLIEIGPLISLLFMITLVSGLCMRGRVGPARVLTLACAYGLYFPLIIYLGVRWDFSIALLTGLLIPGLLFVNYSRWVMGMKWGVLGGVSVLLVYQLCPTLAALAGWNRGMVLLALGIVTLSVIIQFQNSIMRKSLILALLSIVYSPSGQAQTAKVILPAEMAFEEPDRPEPKESWISVDQLYYTLSLHDLYAEARITGVLNLIRAGSEPVPLFNKPVYLSENRSSGNLRWMHASGVPALPPFAVEDSTLDFSIRVPIMDSGSIQQIVVPVLEGYAATGHVLSHKENLRITRGGFIWKKTSDSDGLNVRFDVSGEGDLVMEWSGQAVTGSRSGQGENGSDIAYYGIGIESARHLTLVNSNGSCSHFMEVILPKTAEGTVEWTLPAGSEILSLSVDEKEIPNPAGRPGTCRVDLTDYPINQKKRVSLKLKLPGLDLGFMGNLRFELPSGETTTGTLDWLVSLPPGFESSLLSGNMDRLTDYKPMLKEWGSLAQVLESRPALGFSGRLIHVSKVELVLQYRQDIDLFDRDGHGSSDP